MKAKIFRWIIWGVATIFALFWWTGIGFGLFTDTKETLLDLSSYLIIGFLAFLWENIHKKAMKKSIIDWTENLNLKRIKNAIITLGVICLGILFCSLMFIFSPDFQEENLWLLNSYLIKLSIVLLPLFLYIVYCDYIFVTGKSNALFHVRILFILTVFPLILLVFKSYYIQHPNEVRIGSCSFWATLAITLIILFLIARIMILILLTYKGDTKIVFSKDGIKISELDIFGGLLVTFLMVFLSFLDYTPFQNVFSASGTTKQETHPIKEIDKGINASVTFRPQNATILDSEGNHNFTSFDCPNMNVTDNGNTIYISWGSDNVALNESLSNSDTYIATGNTSRGKVTIKAIRSSASGKIYLVMVAMPNPTPDIQHITINFKP